MSPSAMQSKQRGVALVASMIFLLVVTIISVVAANNSRQGLVMSANLQDGYDSFQSAEAGVIAALATVNTANDIFDRTTSEDIFAGMDASSSPLGNLNTGHTKTAVDVFITAIGEGCPVVEVDPSSEGLFTCDYYRIESEHQVDRKARTMVAQGIIKTLQAL